MLNECLHSIRDDMKPRKNLCTNPKAQTSVGTWHGPHSSISRVSDWESEGIPVPLETWDVPILTGFKASLSGPVDAKYTADFYQDYVVTEDVHRVSLKVYSEQEFSTATFGVRNVDSQGSVLNEASAFLDDPEHFIVGQWNNVECLLPNCTNLHVIQVFSALQASASHPVYFTGLMIEEGWSGGNYADGDTCEWQWYSDGTSSQKQASVPFVTGVAKSDVSAVLQQLRWR